MPPAGADRADAGVETRLAAAHEGHGVAVGRPDGDGVLRRALGELSGAAAVGGGAPDVRGAHERQRAGRAGAAAVREAASGAPRRASTVSEQHRCRGERHERPAAAERWTCHPGPPASGPPAAAGVHRRPTHHTRPRRARVRLEAGSADAGCARGARPAAYAVVQQVVFPMGSPCTSPGALAGSPFGSTDARRRCCVVLVPATCLLHTIVVPAAAHARRRLPFILPVRCRPS